MADTDKVRKEPTLADAIRATKILGAGGAASLISLVLGAGVWLNDAVKTTVKEAVRSEVEPLKERLLRLEVQREYESKAEGKGR
jgi:hypothetical protein